MMKKQNWFVALSLTGKRTGIIQAVTPSQIYEQGQGNLALGEAVQYFKVRGTKKMEDRLKCFL